MVRCSVKYDEELKEQVFFVRGDEDYARSTTTLLTIGDADLNRYSFDLQISLNVLRDKGEGSIVIYDNGDVITVIDDWNSTEDGRTIQLNELTYDIEHTFQAKYMGNKQCSPSSSNIETVMYEETERATTILTVDNTINYKENTAFTKQITLSRTDGHSEHLDNQEINVYVDNVLSDTVTLVNGAGTYQNNGLSLGSHSLYFEFKGDEDLVTSSYSQNISMGYLVSIISRPSIVVGYNNYDYVIRVTDYLNNPITNTQVRMYSCPPSTSPALIRTKTTDSQGYVTFNEEVVYFKCSTTIRSVTYETDVVYADVVYVDDLSVNPSFAQLCKGETNTIVVETYKSGYIIPITVTGEVNTTIYTNANGIATLDVIGEGTNTIKSFSFKVNKYLSDSVQLEDYVQYWAVNNVHNRDYDRGLCNVLDLASYFRVDKVSNAQGFYILFPIDSSKDYEIILSGVSASTTCSVYPACKSPDGTVLISNPPISTNIKFNNVTIKITKSQIVITQNGTTYSTNFLSGSKEYIGFMMTGITQFTFTKLTMQEIV